MVGIAYLANCPKHNTKISEAVPAKRRSTDRSHILLETISALEGLSVRMSAVFCLSQSFCVPSWQLSRQAYSCLYYPSDWLVSGVLNSTSMYIFYLFLSVQLLLLPFKAAFSRKSLMGRKLISFQL